MWWHFLTIMFLCIKLGIQVAIYVFFDCHSIIFHPQIKTLAWVFTFTQLGIPCFTIFHIIAIIFVIFIGFQKLNCRLKALETIDWSPTRKVKYAPVLTLEYMSEEEGDQSHSQRKRTVLPFSWESQKLHLLKQQLDEHELSGAMQKGKVFVNLWRGTRLTSSSKIPRPAGAPSGHSPDSVIFVILYFFLVFGHHRIFS